MKKQPYPITELTGGLDTSKDAMLITDSSSPNVSRIRFRKGLLEKDTGFTTFIDDVNKIPMLYYTYKQYDGDEFLILLTDDHAYKYISTGWSLISTNPGPTFTGTIDNRFWALSIYAEHGGSSKDWMVCSNGYDPIQLFDGSTWAALTGPTNLTAKCAMVLNNRLVLANMRNTSTGAVAPTQVVWSDAGEIDDYVDGTAGSFDIVETPGAILAAATLGSQGFLLKRDSIWELVTTNTTEVFEYRMVVDKLGTVAMNSVQSSGQVIYYVAEDNVYAFDGSVSTPIGGALSAELFNPRTSKMNYKYRNRITSVYLPHMREYWLGVPTTGTSPDYLYKYYEDFNAWTRQPLSHTALGIFYKQASPRTWADAKGTSESWADNAGKQWDVEAVTAQSPTVIYGETGGQTYEGTAASFDTNRMEWQSRDFLFGHAARFVEWRVLCKGTGAFRLAHSEDEGLSWSNEVTFTSHSKHFREFVMFMNVQARSTRLRIRTEAKQFVLKWAEPWYIPKARSITYKA